MIKKIIALSLAAVCWLAAPAGSEDRMSHPTEKYQLANQLTVIAKAIPSAPVVSVFIWYRVGARNEPQGRSGLAHFLEHMLFKGTRHYAKGEISRLIGRTGGHQNAFTSYDYTAYFETVPSEHLDLALAIEADRMRNAILDPKETESERTVILSELDGNRNHPQVRLRDLVNAQSRLQHPYRRPVIGWREEVAKIAAEDLKTFYHQHYQPNNAVLVVVGDFDPQRLKDRIQHHFGKIPAGEVPPASTPAEDQQGLRRVVLNDHGPTALVQISIPIPSAGHEDHYALTVLNDALCKGKTSRLYKALVDKGLAADVSGAPHEMIDRGSWVMNAVCQQGVDPSRVEQAMLAEFQRIKTDGLSAREVERSVNQTRAQLIFSRDSLTDQAMIIGFYQTVAQDWTLPDIFPDRVAAVTPDRLREVAKRFLDESQMTIGHFVPQPGSEPGPLGLPPGDTVSARPGVGEGEIPGALAGSVPSQPDAAASTAAGSLSVIRHVLTNGLILLIQKNPGNPTLALSGLVHAGSVAEPEALPGLATVHARMLDRGTAKYTADQMAEALEFKGAQLSYGVQAEELNFSGEALAEDAPLILDALAQSLTAPVFPQTELDKVRQEVLVSARLAQDSVHQQAWQGFQEMAYPAGHPMRRSLITAEPGVRRLTQKDLKRFHEQWIRPDRTILSLAGDIDPQAVIRLVESVFGEWKNPGVVPELNVPDMAPVTRIEQRSKPLVGKSESLAVLGHEGIRRLDPDYYPAYVANQVLGGSGLTSLLMRTVRDEEGLTYSIYSQFKSARGMRPWCVIFQADPRKVKQAVETTLQQVRRVQNGQVSEQELDDSREQLVGGLALTLETSSGIAFLNREIENHGLGWDYLKSFPRAVRGVKFKDMVTAANRWFHPDRYLLSIAGPAETGSNPGQPNPESQTGLR